MSGDSEVDVAAIIAEFVADPSKSTIDLPSSLSAEQRKVAKGVVDQTPGLKSKSIGFGAERQLHIFKTGAGGDAAEAVRVKNTFIDDWVPDDSSTEPPQFRSMPIGLSRPGEAGMDTAEVDAVAHDLQKLRGPSNATTSDTAVAASTGASYDRVIAPPKELPATALPDGYKCTVRDTFIHIEEPPVIDQRAIQSMPDGMFQRNLQSELNARQEFLGLTPAFGHGVAPSPPPAVPVPAAPQSLAPGTEVIIEGLLKLPAFNGRSGVVQSLDEETGRYNVLLDEIPGDTSCRQAKVKLDNLRPKNLPPPPPQHAPTVLDPDTGPTAGETAPPAPTWDSSSPAKPPLKLDGLV